MEQAERIAELEARIAAVKRVIEFGYDRPGINPLRNGDQCPHGQYEWQDCIACYDECLLAALEPPHA